MAESAGAHEPLRQEWVEAPPDVSYRFVVRPGTLQAADSVARAFLRRRWHKRRKVRRALTVQLIELILSWIQTINREKSNHYGTTTGSWHAAGPESAKSLRQLDRGTRMGRARFGHAGGRVAAGVPGRFAALGKQDPPILQSDSNDAQAIGS